MYEKTLKFELLKVFSLIFDNHVGKFDCFGDCESGVLCFFGSGQFFFRLLSEIVIDFMSFDYSLPVHVYVFEREINVM